MRDQFVTVIPRRGMFVSSIDVSELSTLYETRAILEPYVMRLACARGRAADWDAMAAALERATPGSYADELLEIDRGAARSCGRPPTIASSPTRSTCSTRRATGCGTSTSPTSPTSIT